MSDLKDIVVVAIEQAVAAPYASGRLADAGARVIKVERPNGDFARAYDRLAKGESAYFVWLNRGKESIALNLKQENDLDIVRRMIANADVLIQNLAPGALDKIGLKMETLRKAHPALITCSISGYGEEGPRHTQKAYDLLVQAECGLCAINGTSDGPARVGVSVCDIAAGMGAHAAILQALYARERDPQYKGRGIAISLFHAMADWMNVPMMQHHYGGKTPGRMGLKHPTIAPYGMFECGDGKPLLISIQNETEWASLCGALGKPDLPAHEGFRNNSERVENRGAVDEFVAEAFLKKNRESMIEVLEEANIAFGRLSDLDDFVAHPQNHWISIKSGNDDIEILSPAAIIDGVSPKLGAVPMLNQHGDQLRSEFTSKTQQY